jgi:hypothetical protein
MRIVIQKDTLIEVESYKIESYQTSKSPYEGHYGHYNTKVFKKYSKSKIFYGDYMFYTNQPGVKYLVETLRTRS